DQRRRRADGQPAVRRVSVGRAGLRPGRHARGRLTGDYPALRSSNFMFCMLKCIKNRATATEQRPAMTSAQVSSGLAPGSVPPAGRGLTVRELMSIAISRELGDGEVVLTGAASAIPLAACLLAQARHAPSLTILGVGVYVNPLVLVLEFTAGWDCHPVAIADMSDVFSITELGIDVMFYGGMQIDRYGSGKPARLPTARA